MDTDDAFTLVVEICDRLDRLVVLQRLQIRETQRLVEAVEQLSPHAAHRDRNHLDEGDALDPYPADYEPRQKGLGRLIVGNCVGEAARRLDEKNGSHEHA